VIGWILKFLGGGNLVNMAIAAAVIAAVAGVAGFTSGWTVNGWRLGARIERLQGENTVYAGANARCGVNVAEVKAAVAGIVKAADERAEQAKKGIQKAEAAALGHINRAAGIIQRPPVPPEKQCDVVQLEQVEYVNLRREEISKLPQ
jgi:hypothetical protein